MIYAVTIDHPSFVRYTRKAAAVPARALTETDVRKIFETVTDSREEEAYGIAVTVFV